MLKFGLRSLFADGLGNKVAHTADSRANRIESVQGAGEVGVDTGYGFALDHDGEQRESARVEGCDQGGTVVAAVAGTVHPDVFPAFYRGQDRAGGTIGGRSEERR